MRGEESERVRDRERERDSEREREREKERERVRERQKILKEKVSERQVSHFKFFFYTYRFLSLFLSMIFIS